MDYCFLMCLLILVDALLQKTVLCWWLSAPSVIACVGKDAADLDERVGYYGEKLVLRPGKTFIAVFPNFREDKIEIQ